MLPTPMPNLPSKPIRHDGVVGQDDDEQQAEIQEVAVDVLHDERERSLTPVRLARLADGAARRILPERLVVGAAIVITGEPEAARRPEMSSAAENGSAPATIPASARTRRAELSPNSSGE
jgi:hypothetical protein